MVERMADHGVLFKEKPDVDQPEDPLFRLEKFAKDNPHDCRINRADSMNMIAILQEGIKAAQDLDQGDTMLDNKEELELAKSRGVRACNVLILANKGVAHAVADRMLKLDDYRHGYRDGYYEDMVQAGCIGLKIGMELYDPDLGFELSTYIFKAAHSAICKEIAVQREVPINKYYQTRPTPVSLDQPRYRGDIEGDTLIETISAKGKSVEDLVIERVDTTRAVTALLNLLDPEEYSLICLTYGLNGQEPQTGTQIAKKMGVTRQAVNYRLQNIRRKLQAESASAQY